MDHEEAVPNPHYLMYCVCVTVHKENYTAKMIFWMYRSQEEILCVYEETFVTEIVVQFLFEIHNTGLLSWSDSSFSRHDHCYVVISAITLSKRLFHLCQKLVLHCDLLWVKYLLCIMQNCAVLSSIGLSSCTTSYLQT